MTFQESSRCPVCLELGRLRYQFGDLCCDKCDRTFSCSTLQHFLDAFEAGRKFEKDQQKTSKVTFCFCPRCGIEMNPKHDISNPKFNAPSWDKVIDNLREECYKDHK